MEANRRDEIMALACPVTAAVLFVATLVGLSRFHGLIVDWAGGGTVGAATLAIAAVVDTAVILTLILAGSAFCRRARQD